MISSLLKKVFGSRNDRLVKQYRQTVARINALESGLTGLSDEALGAKTAEFRQRLANGETLEQLLPEAFAENEIVDIALNSAGAILNVDLWSAYKKNG